MNNHQPNISRPLVQRVALLSIALVATSCGGPLFKVKPAVNLPPLAANARTASAGGVVIRVAPLLSDEESQNLFEANLPLSGVLPLRIEMAYESGVPVELKQVKFHLRDADGHEWKLLAPKQAVSRILKSNGISVYNPNSRKQFEQDFTAYSLDLKTPLTGSETRRQGFLFFATPGNHHVESPQGLVLVIERLPQPVEINLN